MTEDLYLCKRSLLRNERVGVQGALGECRGASEQAGALVQVRVLLGCTSVERERRTDLMII